MITKRKSSLSILKAFGILLITIPIIILSLNKIYDIINRKEDIKKINAYFEETSHNQEIPIDNKSNKINEEESLELNYIAVLEIPEISLKKGLFSTNNKYNDVNYNVTILPTSEMPNVINSNLILASHNGSSKVSYFKNLSKLNKGSLIYIYYQGTKYVYKVNNYYEINKGQEIDIVRDRTVNTITLITCKDNSDTLQIAYIAYLISTETY